MSNSSVLSKKLDIFITIRSPPPHTFALISVRKMCNKAWQPAGIALQSAYIWSCLFTLVFHAWCLKGSMSVVKLEDCRQHIRAQLDGVVEFWLKYSHDTEHGYCSYTFELPLAMVHPDRVCDSLFFLYFRGFFTCIGRDGNVYDELKFVWLQGRQVSLSNDCFNIWSSPWNLSNWIYGIFFQVWMYCRLYRSLDRFHRPEILEAAKAGKFGVCHGVWFYTEQTQIWLSSLCLVFT